MEPSIQVDTAVATDNVQDTADRLAAYRSAGSLAKILDPLKLYLDPSSPPSPVSLLSCQESGAR